MADNNRIPIGDRVVIYQRGVKKIWYADFHENGQHRRKSLRTKNRKVAEQRARKLDTELISGEYKPPAPAVKLADAKEQFISAMKEAGRKHKTILKYEKEIGDLVAFANAQGVVNVKDFTPEVFQKYRKQRSN